MCESVAGKHPDIVLGKLDTEAESGLAAAAEAEDPVLVGGAGPMLDREAHLDEALDDAEVGARRAPDSSP